MEFPNKTNKDSSLATAPFAPDQVTKGRSTGKKIGEDKSRGKLVSPPRRPRPPAPDKPPVATKPKRKPPPLPAKTSRSSLQSDSNHAPIPLSTPLCTNSQQHIDQSNVDPRSKEESHEKNGSSEDSRVENKDKLLSQSAGSPQKPPPPLPNSPPSVTRLARSHSSSKFSPSKNSISKSESQNSLSTIPPSPVSDISTITSTSQLPPVSSPSPCLSATPVSTECMPSAPNVKKSPSKSESLNPFESCSDKSSNDPTSQDHNLQQHTCAIAVEKKDKTAPLQIDVSENKEILNELSAQTQLLKAKTPPLVPRKSPKRVDNNASSGQNLSLSSSPVSQSSPPPRPPPPSVTTPPAPPIPASRRSFSQAACPVSPPSCRGASPGHEQARNVTNAGDEDVRQTELNSSETGTKSEPPPLPKNPPRRGLLKRQKSVLSEATSTPASQNAVSRSHSSGREGHIRKKEQNNDFPEQEKPSECIRTANVINDCKKKQCSIDKVGSGEERVLSSLENSQSKQNSQEVLNQVPSSDPSQSSKVGENSTSIDSNAENEDVRPKVTQRRPVPKKRLSIPPSPSEGELSEQSQDKQNSSENLCCPEEKPEKELDYAEVYVTKRVCTTEEGFLGNNASGDKSQSGEVNDGTSNKSTVPLEDFQNSPNDPDHQVKAWNRDHGNSLRLDEPDETCDMLKEIEELLISKLSAIDIERESGGISPLADANSVAVEDDTPKRPPRPKREASLSKQKSGSRGFLQSVSVDSPTPQSLSTVDLQFSPEGENNKLPPQKPKRMTLPRVNRSQSDVTGTKELFSSLEGSGLFSSSSCSLNSEPEKPVLPPRSESLNRGYTGLSQIPPPLPPRNKTCTVSSPMINSLCMSKSDSSPSQTTIPNMNNNVKIPEDGTSSPPLLRPSKMKSKTGSFTQSQSKEGLSSAGSSMAAKKHIPPRPSRKAPPPPSKSKGLAEKCSSRALSSPEKKESAKRDMGNSQKNGSSVNKGSPGSAQDSISECPSGLVEKMGKFYQAMSGESVQPDIPIKPDSIKHNRIPSTKDQENDVLKRAESTKDEKSTENHQDEKSTQSLQDEKSTQSLPDEKSTQSHQDEQSTQSHQDEKSTQSLPDEKSTQSLPDEKSTQSLPDEKSTQSLPDEKSTQSHQDEQSTQSHQDEQSTQSHQDEQLSNVESEAGSAEISTAISSTDGNFPPIANDIDNQSDTEGDKDETDGPNSSASDSEEDPEVAKEIYQSQKRAKKIFNIAKEITSSENIFVDSLRLLNVDFRHHISKEAEKQEQPIIPSDNLNKILQFLPQLQNLNEELLKDLEQRISNWNENPVISDIFVKKGPFLKLYSSYIGNYNNAMAILDESCKKYPRFAAAVKNFQMTPRSANLHLTHYMLTPIQRIGRYKLLLMDYLKHLSPDSDDFKPAQMALGIVSEVADHANDSMKHGDEIQELLDIQRNLIGHFEVIQPGRVFIKQGELIKISRKENQPRRFFLFSDVLLYTTPVTIGYKLNNILQLTRMQVEVPKVEELSYEINIISKERSFTVCASSQKEKDEWLEALTKAIEENIERYQTFIKHSEAEDKSRLEESLLGHKAPVWVPDTRVTMCMLCLSEFTITWRRHHCRSCGKIVCKYCSGNTAPLPYLDDKLARVCDKCFEILNEASKKAGSDTDAHPNEGMNGTAPETDESKTTGKPSSPDKNSGFGLNKMISSLWNGNRKKSSSSIPSVLKEVHANDDDSDISGYLRAFKNRKWKRLWFLVKSNVIYTFQACEDRAAAESMPLIGYKVITFTTSFEGVEADCLFELLHDQSKPYKGSSSANSDKMRFIFRADNSSSAEKWMNVLREATQA